MINDPSLSLGSRCRQSFGDDLVNVVAVLSIAAVRG